MKVALYARVSSEKQAEKEIPIAGQIKTLREYAQSHGWELYREFVDEAISGSTDKRPEFQNMIALAEDKNRPFDAILVWSYSRFTRNHKDLLVYTFRLEKCKVSLVSITEPIEDNYQGKFFKDIVGAVNELHLGKLAEDTIRGMKENASRGYLNGGKLPIGYKKKKVAMGSNEKSTLELDEQFAPVVQRVFQMCLEETGAKKIVEILNAEGLRTDQGKLWNKNLVLAILKNEKYTGTLLWRIKKSGETVRVENSHPAIIAAENFKRVQALLESRSPKITHPRSVESVYLLSGLIYCQKCEAKMAGVAAKSGQVRYYMCSKQHKMGKTACDTKAINKEKLESVIIQKISEEILTEGHLKELLKLTNENLENGKVADKEQLDVLDKQSGEVSKRLDKLYESLETGKLTIDELAPRIKDLKNQKDALQSQRNEVATKMEQAKPRSVSLEIIRYCVENMQEVLKNGEFQSQKAFLRSFIKSIVVNKSEIVVNYQMPVKTTKAELQSCEVLPIALCGSPSPDIDRTFQSVFFFEPDIPKQVIPKSYRNPIIIAREWQEIYHTHNFTSYAQLAENLCVSRARVSQVLNLLKLSPEVQKILLNLGEFLTGRFVTERKLRILFSLSAPKQLREIKKILVREKRETA